MIFQRPPLAPTSREWLVTPAESTLPAASDPAQRDFRDALGCFATGVTVVTTIATDGCAIGVTISSFNSVSLDPPLIVWSLSRESPKLTAFAQNPHYAVNVLALGQQSLSERFASRDDAGVDGLAVRIGLGGVPLIAGCSAWFECTHEAQHAGGDHLVLIGRVLRFDRCGAGEPLIFHGGRYRALRSE